MTGFRFSSMIMFFCFFISTAAADSMTFDGVGYPPLRVANRTHALIMARRAAVLDAYRNALRSAAENGTDETGPEYYEEVAGFLRHVKVVGETYLANGGVRITVMVNNENRQVQRYRKSPMTGDEKRNNGQKSSGPAVVNKTEWFRIIEKMVVFESDP